VIAAALLVGSGLVLLTLGIIRRRRRETDADDRRSKL
jgi:hypothetical protein